MRRPEWPDDLPRTIYVDGYGNVMTGPSCRRRPNLRRSSSTALAAACQNLLRSTKGSAVLVRKLQRLLEIAANMERAADRLDLRVGMSVHVEM